MKIAIDIGHSKKNSGAVSARGISEYHYNRMVALSLFYKLQEKGIYTFFVNQTEEEISLKERVNSAKRQNATLFISIHHDSVKEAYLSTWTYNDKKRRYCDKFSGYGIFVSPKNEYFNQSLDVAKEIGNNLRNKGFTPTLHHTENIEGERKKMYNKYLGVYRYDNLVVLKYAAMPAVLIEGGVILNRKEEISIGTPGRIDRFTSAVANAIMKSDSLIEDRGNIESW